MKLTDRRYYYSINAHVSAHSDRRTDDERAYDALEAELAAVRAVLGPLLEQFGRFDRDRQRDFCLFCGVYDEGNPIRGELYDHKPDCPVLRTDELLGRG